MQLSIDNLEESGAFTGELVKRQMTYVGKGEREYTVDVYLRRLSYLEVMKHFSGDDHSDLLTERICECVVDENGVKVFEKHDVTGFYEDGSPVLDKNGKPRGGIPSQVASELVLLIAEVNGLGKSKNAD